MKWTFLRAGDYRRCLSVMIVALLAASCGPGATSQPTGLPKLLPPSSTPVSVAETRAAPTAEQTATPTVVMAVPTRTPPAQIEGPEGVVPMGFTEDGLPYRGNPQAPVTMVEHSEFQ